MSEADSESALPIDVKVTVTNPEGSPIQTDSQGGEEEEKGQPAAANTTGTDSLHGEAGQPTPGGTTRSQTDPLKGGEEGQPAAVGTTGRGAGDTGSGTGVSPPADNPGRGTNGIVPGSTGSPDATQGEPTTARGPTGGPESPSDSDPTGGGPTGGPESPSDSGPTGGGYTESPGSKTDTRNPSGPNMASSGTPMMSAPSGDLEREMQVMVADTAKQTEEGDTALSESKDRAQMTANTALSLSLIVVLKGLLDQGPQLNKYYYVSMTLVSLSLICQVVIGLLALVMYSLKSKTGKKKGGANPNMQLVGVRGGNIQLERLSMMPVRMDAVDGKGGRVNQGFDATRLDMNSAPPRHDLPDGATGSSSGYTTSELYQRYLEAAAEPKSGCCPGGCFPCDDDFGDDLSQVDQATVKIYEILCLEQMKALLEFAEVKMQSVSTQYGATGGVPEEVDSTLEVVLKEKWSRLKMIGVQEKLVGLKLRMMRKRKLLGQITMVQNAITYLMYVVFILNAFVTGFGLT